MPPAEPATDEPVGDVNGRVLGPRGARTRARMVTAGAEVFAEKGFHAARVSDIVQRAKSSHGTFYLYFSSKEDLFDQLVADVAARLASLVDDLPRVTNSDKGRAALRDWLARFCDLYDEHGEVIRTWTEVELSGADVGRRADDALGALIAGLVDSVRIPKRTRIDPVVASLALMMMIERFSYYAATGQVEVSRDELLDTLVDVIGAAVLR